MKVRPPLHTAANEIRRKKAALDNRYEIKIGRLRQICAAVLERTDNCVAAVNGSLSLKGGQICTMTAR
jgi:hypothetical protein